MTDIVVLKFGGSSVANLERLQDVARLVISKRDAGFRVVVVVSARAKMTDSLIADAKFFGPQPAPREMDMLLTSGERISAALLAIALHSSGVEAVSLTGSQAGIITDDDHTNARIIEIRPARVFQALSEGKIVVVSGFQGVSFRKEITTLGRGGSDITAVALASALEAAACEIYSDVDGVFAADPAVVTDPVRIPELSYQEMQEMAESGAKVLNPRSVEFAKLKRTIIHAKSTFVPDGEGTIIKDLEGRIKPRVVGIASEEKVLVVDCWGTEQRRIAAAVTDFLASANVKVKQMAFHWTSDRGMLGNFIIAEKENYHLDSVIPKLEHKFDGQLTVARHLGAVSLIGAGINDRYDFLQDSLELLARNSIEVFSFHTSSFRISLVIKREELNRAVSLLYDRFLRETESAVSGQNASS